MHRCTDADMTLYMSARLKHCCRGAADINKPYISILPFLVLIHCFRQNQATARIHHMAKVSSAEGQVNSAAGRHRRIIHTDSDDEALYSPATTHGRSLEDSNTPVKPRSKPHKPHKDRSDAPGSKKDSGISLKNKQHSLGSADEHSDDDLPKTDDSLNQEDSSIEIVNEEDDKKALKTPKKLSSNTDDLDDLMNRLTIATSPSPSKTSVKQKKHVIKVASSQPKGLFAKLEQQKQASTLKNSSAHIPKLTPHNESSWRSNPILNLPASPTRPAPNNAMASPNRSFNQSSASLMEPLTPKSYQWSQKVSLSALRKPVPFNIGSPTKPTEDKYSREHMILSGKVPSLQSNPNVKAGWSIPSSASAGNSFSYISNEKALDKVKDLLQSFDREEEFSKVDVENFKGVSGLKCQLLPHQIHGLKFLQSRELPESPVTGGLLCDDMGLGKTVQSIALILTRQYDKKILKEHDALVAEGDSDMLLKKKSNSNDKAEKVDKEETKEKVKKIYKSTLVIAPVALATQWADEIKTKAPQLKVTVHYGKSRAESSSELKKYDVVISTYQILMGEWQSEGPLFDRRWWRIILDEAHTIKNKDSKTAKACFALEAYSRWCLTGTPVQNNINELFSFIKFLKVSPMDNYKFWTDQIAKPMADGAGLTAMHRLQGILKGIMLRRTKDVLKKTNIGLPKRTVHRELLEFSPNERQVYDLISSRIGGKIASIAESGKKSYFEGLTLLLRLRQACCHVDLIHGKVDMQESDEILLQSSQVKKDETNNEKNAENVDDLADILGGMSLEKDLTTELLKDVQLEEGALHKQTNSNTKINYLLKILKNEPKRKTIVFSQFTSFLDLIEPCLKNAGIQYARYDGSMNKQKRDQALERLKQNEEVQVLLISLKSGAVGLNLTAASQVVLLDPWWNPMISEQAIDRVHRIGQKRDVDVHELIMKETVEEKILLLQDKKRALAQDVFGGSGSKSRQGHENAKTLNMEELLRLFENN